MSRSYYKVVLQLRYVIRTELAPLAWCARADRSSGCVTVTHGAGVETGPAGFVEGAWPGAFGKFDFLRSHALMGSGGRLAGDGLMLATPSHALERLHLVRRGDALFASNSLAFLLAAADLALDPGYVAYKNDLWSITRGLEHCERELPTRGGPPVRLAYYCNLEIAADLAIRERPKSVPESWPDFASYRRFLSQTLAGIALNAAAAERRGRYRLLASISSGYDSAACTALAAEAGCRDAVSFRSGVHFSTRAGVRVARGPADDSGATIARALGLTVTEFERDDCRRATERCAEEIAAAGDAFDFQFAALEKLLPGRVLVSGFNGDNIWDRLAKRPSAHFVRHNEPPTGTSLGEFRLRAGFLHCPAPFLGGVLHPAIHAISCLPEMSPWTIGGAYDRPIARRILEEKGVPRGTFARGKTGSFSALQRAREAASGAATFEEAYARHRAGFGLLRRGSDEAVYFARRVQSRLTKWSEYFGVPQLVAPRHYTDIPIPGRLSFVVPWGVAALRERYLRAIQ
jgi:hypothetical protein